MFDLYLLYFIKYFSLRYELININIITINNFSFIYYSSTKINAFFWREIHERRENGIHAGRYDTYSMRTSMIRIMLSISVINAQTIILHYSIALNRAIFFGSTIYCQHFRDGCRWYSNGPLAIIFYNIERRVEKSNRENDRFNIFFCVPHPFHRVHLRHKNSRPTRTVLRQFLRNLFIAWVEIVYFFFLYWRVMKCHYRTQILVYEHRRLINFDGKKIIKTRRSSIILCKP